MKIHELSGYIEVIYLVEYDHGLLLLDGCCRADIDLIQQFITQDLGRPITDLKTVVVTHMHPDHAGGAHLLRKLTGCRLVSADKDFPWYRGINGILMHWLDVLLTWYVARKMKKPLKWVWYSRVLKPDVKIRDGERVPEFEDWQILETPGHTDRCLSLWHKPSHRIYIADVMIKLRNRFISPFPLFHPNKYKATIERIESMNADGLLLAHGGQVHPNEIDFKDFLSRTPNSPRTPLRATLFKFKQLWRQNAEHTPDCSDHFLNNSGNICNYSVYMRSQTGECHDLVQ